MTTSIAVLQQAGRVLHIAVAGAGVVENFVLDHPEAEAGEELDDFFVGEFEGARFGDAFVLVLVVEVLGGWLCLGCVCVCVSLRVCRRGSGSGRRWGCRRSDRLL